MRREAQGRRKDGIRRDHHWKLVAVVYLSSPECVRLNRAGAVADDPIPILHRRTSVVIRYPQTVTRYPHSDFIERLALLAPGEQRSSRRTGRVPPKGRFEPRTRRRRVQLVGREEFFKRGREGLLFDHLGAGECWWVGRVEVRVWVVRSRECRDGRRSVVGLVVRCQRVGLSSSRRRRRRWWRRWRRWLRFRLLSHQHGFEVGCREG